VQKLKKFVRRKILSFSEKFQRMHFGRANGLGRVAIRWSADGRHGADTAKQNKKVDAVDAVCARLVYGRKFINITPSLRGEKTVMR
jgi:hypothetical protein